jgi:hypothetical protein
MKTIGGRLFQVSLHPCQSLLESPKPLGAFPLFNLFVSPQRLRGGVKICWSINVYIYIYIYIYIKIRIHIYMYTYLYLYIYKYIFLFFLKYPWGYFCNFAFYAYSNRNMHCNFHFFLFFCFFIFGILYHIGGLPIGTLGAPKVVPFHVINRGSLPLYLILLRRSLCSIVMGVFPFLLFLM